MRLSTLYEENRARLYYYIVLMSMASLAVQYSLVEELLESTDSTVRLVVSVETCTTFS